MAEEKRRWPNQKFKKEEEKPIATTMISIDGKKKAFLMKQNLEGELCENFKKDVVD